MGSNEHEAAPHAVRVLIANRGLEPLKWVWESFPIAWIQVIVAIWEAAIRKKAEKCICISAAFIKYILTELLYLKLLSLLGACCFWNSFKEKKKKGKTLRRVEIKT